MTPLETLKFDYKQKGYLDPDKVFRVLEDVEAKIARLDGPTVFPGPTTPYTPPEAH